MKNKVTKKDIQRLIKGQSLNDSLFVGDNSALISPKPSDWGEGEWLNEPGMAQIEEFEYKGYPCKLTRNFNGSWCGYVGISPESKYTLEENYRGLDIHGSVTWYTRKLPWKTRKDNFFWLGFDCSHYTDYSPRGESLGLANPLYKLFNIKKTYRTLEFAKNQLRGLIDQIEESKCQTKEQTT